MNTLNFIGSYQAAILWVHILNILVALVIAYTLFELISAIRSKLK